MQFRYAKGPLIFDSRTCCGFACRRRLEKCGGGPWGGRFLIGLEVKRELTMGKK